MGNSKIISGVLLLSLFLQPLLVFAEDTQTDFDSTKSQINALQIVNPSLPTGVSQQRGRVGDIMSKLFDPYGKIGNWYIKALQEVEHTAVMRWVGGKNGRFMTGSLYDTGTGVGVGTSSPSKKLDIAGDINFSGDIYKNNILYTFGSKFIDGTNPLNAAYMLGNVGIGILAPTEKLDVVGNIKASGTFIGDGSTLTNLNAGNISSGTINTNRLPTDVVKTTGNQTIGGTKTFSSTIVGSVNGNAATATALQTSRTINGVGFNGTANITLPTVNTSGDQTVAGIKTFSSPIVGSVTGNAGTATALETARNIAVSGDVTGTASFNGTANISIASTIANDAVTSAKILNGTIVNADVNAGAAIAGTKISPNFGTQNISGQRLLLGTNNAASVSDIDLDSNALITTENNLYLVSDSDNNETGDTASIIFGANSNSTTGLSEYMRINNSGNVGIGNVSPSEKLDVTGNIKASGTFIGDGSTITNIAGDNIQDGTVDGSEIQDGTITAADIAANAIGNSELASNAVQSVNITNGAIVDADVNASAAIAGTKISPNFGTQNIVTTGTVSGVGSGLTGLNASNLASGTVPDARLSGNVVMTSGNQTIAGTKTFSSTIAGSITGNAGTATALATARNIAVSGDVTGTASFNGTANISIASTIANDAVTSAKIAANTIVAADIAANAIGNSELATNAVQSVNITNGAIVDADVNASAAIAGTKISPNFGNQDINTTAQYIGGFGAKTTGGTLDWNHSSNARSGNGYSLLLGTATNGPSVGGYYHPFTFEYNAKDGTGNMTQFAVPYNSNQGMYLRSRYTGTWGGWQKMLIENTSGDVSISGNLTLGGTLGGDSITDGTIDSSEIQDGTLTAADLASNSVASDEIVDGTIVDADVNAGAAIAGTKISPNFGSQDITTTGNVNLRSAYFSNLEPTSLDADGHVGFDSSRGMIIYRTQTPGQESGVGGYTVLDTANITGGSGINITNTAAGTAGLEAITFSVAQGAGSGLDADLLDGIDSSGFVQTSGNQTIAGTKTFSSTIVGSITGDAGTLDGINSTSFIRSDAATDVTADTEWQDSQEVRLGSSADLRLFHNGSNSYIRNYTGDLELRNLSNGSRIYMQGADAGGTNRNMLIADPDNAVTLYYNGASKFATTNTGIDVTGTVTADEPTAASHLTTKNYVDTLVSAGVSWKAPVATSAAATYGACDASKEGWATYNKSDDIVYLCDATAWISIGSSASIPYATTGTAGKMQIAGDIQGTWNNITIKDGVIDSAAITNNTIVAGDIAANAIGNSELAANAVQSVNIANGTIVSADISTDTITAGNLAANSVGDSELIDNPTVSSLLWKNGAHRITNNDGGGNANIRFGHEVSSGDKFTQNGASAVRIRADVDGATPTLYITPSSNSGNIGDLVTWGPGLTLTPTSFTYGANEVLTTASSINGANITANTITATQIANNTITATQINANAIGNSELASNAVQSVNIANGTITGADILNNTIDETEISDSFVARDSNLLDGIDSTNFLRSNTSDTMNGNISFPSQDLGTTFTHVSNASIPTIRTSGNHITGGSDYAGLGKLNNVAIQTWYGFSVSPTISGQPVSQGTPAFSVNARNGQTEIAGNLILGGTLSGDSITDNTIDSSEIENGTIVSADIAANAIGSSELNNTGNFIINSININSNSDLSPTSTAHGLTVGGTTTANIGIDGNEIMARNNGVVSPIYIQNEGGLTTIGGGLTVNGGVISGNGSSITSINGANITANTITATQIANNTITATQINANAIGNSELASNAVQSVNIANGTVTGADILNNTIDETEISDSFVARDSNLLDGVNSTQFLRSDTDDSLTAAIVVPTGNRDEGMFGTYASTLTQHIWSMGTAYRNSAAGTDFGNLYGLAYKHTNNPTGGNMAGGHQVVWVENGTPKSALGTNIWTSGTFIGNGASITNIAGDNIQNGTVDGSEIQDLSITAADIAANAITGSELANNSVTSSHITNGTIVNADISNSAAIAGSKISPNFGSQDITGNNLYVTGDYIYGDGKVMLRYNDTWLRLNQNNHFTNGTYTPYVLRADGGLFVGDDESFSRVAEDVIGTTDNFEVTGYITASSRVVAGQGVGSVGMTVNDGGGNANLTFNHIDKTPGQNGNSGRIAVNVDATSNAAFDFQLKSNVTSGVTVGATSVLAIYEDGDMQLKGTSRMIDDVTCIGNCW